MEYNDLEDLVFSRSFRNWVLQCEAADMIFWEDWLSRHSDKADLVQHARAVVYALQLNLRTLSDAEIDLEMGRALHRLRDTQLTRPLRDPYPERPRSRGWIWGVAGLLIALGITVWVIQIYTHRHWKDPLRNFLADNSDNMRQLIGENDSVVLLPDNSKVRLKPNSKLYYPKGLFAAAGRRREVFLEGEAFFDVAHNISKPFYIYTNTLITRVLGSQVSVRAWPSERKTVISRGQLSVYRKEESDGVVVTPNQELVYDRHDDRLSKTLVRHPEMIRAQDTVLAFDATPVSSIFQRLQDVYGIPIVYDEESMTGRSLSATLNEGSFYDKLTIICKAIHAAWAVEDGDIIITL